MQYQVKDANIKFRSQIHGTNKNNELFYLIFMLIIYIEELYLRGICIE